MISEELKYRICEAFSYVPTPEQEMAINVFVSFMTDGRLSARGGMSTGLRGMHEEHVMVLRGSAGTGKTTLAAAIVQALLSLKQKLVLMAPTGRAAKVFSSYAGHAAFTIHRRIYRQKSLEGHFELNYNNASDTLFIVDEASMIANGSAFGETIFAGGQLLDDLMEFVYNGRNCRLMLIGDPAQLPPVGEQNSCALMSDVLSQYGLKVYETDMRQVLRQSQGSGILFNATRIRKDADEEVYGNRIGRLPKIRFAGFPDIKAVSGEELIDALSSMPTCE